MVIPMATRALRVSEHMLPHPHRPLVSPTVWEQNQRQRPSTPPDRAAARPRGHTPAAPRLFVRRWGALALALHDGHTLHIPSCSTSLFLGQETPMSGRDGHTGGVNVPESGLPAYGPHCPPTLTLCPGAALWALLQCTLAPMSGRVTSFQASCNPSVPTSPGTLWPQKCPPPGTLASFSPPNSPKRTLLPCHHPRPLLS